MPSFNKLRETLLRTEPLVSLTSEVWSPSMRSGASLTSGPQSRASYMLVPIQSEGIRDWGHLDCQLDQVRPSHADRSKVRDFSLFAIL